MASVEKLLLPPSSADALRSSKTPLSLHLSAKQPVSVLVNRSSNNNRALIRSHAQARAGGVEGSEGNRLISESPESSLGSVAAPEKGKLRRSGRSAAAASLASSFPTAAAPLASPSNDASRAPRSAEEPSATATPSLEEGATQVEDEAAARVGAAAPPPQPQVAAEKTASSSSLEVAAQSAQGSGKKGKAALRKLASGSEKAGKKKIDNPISIVFVSSEVAPYSKTGGLGDVVGSLPIALAARGHRVMVVAPRYLDGVNNDRYKRATDCQKRINCYCFSGEHQVAFFHEFRDGVDFVFVDHPAYHRPGTPYGDTQGAFGDNQFRFTLLCHAACEAPLQLELGGFIYGQKVLFFANDWHAGLVPVLIASKYRKFGVYKDARSIIAIHNMWHQGVEPAHTFSNLGVPADWYGALEWIFPTWQRMHAFDKGEAVNILKGALVTADRIVTVSPGYAWEITTREGGWGLDSMLRGRNSVLNGVTNGVDTDTWNPATDKNIAVNFTADDMAGKAACKAALQRELGLAERPEVPLIGFIGRLDAQKGPDVIQAALPELMSDDVQFVMLGSGEPQLEAWMAWAEGAYEDKFRGWIGFSVPMAHRITAGCDMLLMPSRFEPCGLNQLYAMRYGTVPVVHATGGLRDTVEDFNPFANQGAGAGTGWTFSPLSKEAMMGALWTAILTYRKDKPSWEGLMARGMLQDMSWDQAAAQYEQVFEWAMIDPPYA